MILIGKIFALLCILSLVFGILSGRLTEVSTAAIDGAAKAVSLTISLAGMMGLWGGIMQIAKKSGIISVFTRFLRPVTKRLFPQSADSQNVLEDITAALSANMLGLGNAATPLALRAMKSMGRDCSGRYTRVDSDAFEQTSATDDMITFTVMSTSPFNILPTTIIALLRGAGSKNPFDIIIPVWIVSFVGCIVSVFFSKLLSPLWKQIHKKGVLGKNQSKKANIKV